MPIQTNVRLNTYTGPTTTNTLQLESAFITSNSRFNLSSTVIYNTAVLQQDFPYLFRWSTLGLVDTEVTAPGYLSLHDTALDTKSALGLFASEIHRSINTRLDIGTPPLTFNDFIVFTQMNLVNPLKEAKAFLGLITDVAERTRYGHITLRASGTLSDSDNLNLIDVLGPEIFNEVPSAGSYFNDPDNTIYFDLIDTGGAEITASSVQFFVNEVLVVDAGIDVTPPAFGTTAFTKVDDSSYTFYFVPTNPFDLGTEIVISGSARDSIEPGGNLSEYLYSFGVWSEGVLYASILGIPDADDPILDSILPLPYSVEVPADTSISFDLYDEHTGVDFESVIISVEDTVLISGGSAHNTGYAAVTESGIYEQRGKHYEIDLTSDFPFGSVVEVEVYAEDQYSPANVLDTSYIFNIQPNGHLVVSGLTVYEDTQYQAMYVGESYVTTSSTPFYIDFVNTSGIALDMASSYIESNGTSIPFTYSAISGNYYYRVFFDLEPEYKDDANLLFYIQQSGTVYGNTVDREFNARLLWGYEVCYDNTDAFDYDIPIKSTISVCDFGDFYTQGNIINKFTTIPLKGNNINASIIGISPPAEEITGTYTSNNTFYEYGKTMNLTLEAEDYAGNKLLYNWNYTIEDNS